MILGNNFLKNQLTALGYIFGISKTLFPFVSTFRQADDIHTQKRKENKKVENSFVEQGRPIGCFITTAWRTFIL